MMLRRSFDNQKSVTISPSTGQCVDRYLTIKKINFKELGNGVVKH